MDDPFAALGRRFDAAMDALSPGERHVVNKRDHLIRVLRWVGTPEGTAAGITEEVFGAAMKKVWVEGRALDVAAGVESTWLNRSLFDFNVTPRGVSEPLSIHAIELTPLNN
jgi:hypothetical protein